MGFFGGIGSFFSGVCSAIGGAVSAIGRGICSLGGAIFSGIGAIASGIANFLTPKNRIEEKDHEKFSYAAELKDIKPENYESVSAYIEAGKEAMNNLTPEEEAKLNTLTPEEKKKYVSNTYSTQIQAFAEEIGMKEPIPLGAIEGAATINMNATEFKQLAVDYKEGKIPTMDIKKALNSKLDPIDDIKMFEYLQSRLDKLNGKEENIENKE